MKPITKLIVTAFLLCSMVCGPWTRSYAAIPHLINYQGKLTDPTGKALTGTYGVTFRIYDVEAGGSPLWSETYSSLSVDKGIFSVMLGGVTPLNLAFDRQYWLSIQVASDPEMTPRQRLASSAYAYKAESVTGVVPIANGGTGSAATNYCDLTTNVTGVLPAANGGTGKAAAPSVYTAYGTNVMTDSNIYSYATLSAASVAGQKAHIVFMADTHTYNNQVYVNIQVDGVTRAISTVRASDHGDHYMICCQWVESPSAGTHTYRITSSGGFNNWAGNTWSLVVTII